MLTDYIKTKVVSSMEKCFLDEDLSGHPEVKEYTVFNGERLSFQFAVYTVHRELYRAPRARVLLEGDAAPYAAVREVISVPVQYPTSYIGFDPDILREKPCLAPDPIRPLHYNGEIVLQSDQTTALWIDVRFPEDFPAGDYALTVKLQNCDGQAAETVRIHAAGLPLPKQKLIHTEWFYTDCIAEAYHTRPFSERHFKLIEKYLRMATENGINMILTPVFTPELDTYIGGYRETTQLVKITVTGKDTYEFDFSLLERFLTLARACGVEYFEIPHFFSQWGAAKTPKFVASVNGRMKRIFGWDTDAMGDEYRIFLEQFLPQLIACLEKNGVLDQCFFHISDEPHPEHLEHYKRCHNLIASLIGDRKIIDALSSYEFYKTGAIRKPVSAIYAIDEFIKNKVPGLWAYYCGNQTVLTGRGITMPLYRTRILGVQLWLSGIEGFLHWGFNFYHNENSHEYVDPFGNTCGEYFAPSGDAFLVYPGIQDEPWESMRLCALREAVDDMRALDLLAEKKGRAFAEKLLLDTAGMPVTFREYPRDAAFFLRLRERIAAEVRL